VRDQDKIRQLENRWRTYEQAHLDSSHAFKEHVDVDDQYLADRAGKFSANPKAPKDATRWRSADAAVVAYDGLRRSDDYEQQRADKEAIGLERFEVRRPLSEVVGRDWRADVSGRTAASRGAQASQWNDNSVAVGRWQRGTDGRWHPITCYPQPGP
jgi:hypothetical protein